MAKAARFKVGSSGSGKHTESRGDGTSMGGRAPAERGPRIGAGVMGSRVKPEYDRDAQRGARAPRSMSRYTEE